MQRKNRKPRLSLYEAKTRLTPSVGELCPFAYVITKVKTNPTKPMTTKTKDAVRNAAKILREHNTQGLPPEGRRAP
jgi:hypothetical protein